MSIARILCLTVLATLAAGCGRDAAEPKVYDKARVEHGSITVSVSSAGVVEPLTVVEVKSKASGEVLELDVDTGDYVKAGTLMVRIDPRTVRNRLDQAEAELKAAMSKREIAETQMKRAQALLKKGTFTETDVEQATLDLANAQAQVVTSRVSVENARIAVDDTDVRAPISGTIIDKPVEKGQVISSPTQDFAGGTLLMRMADLSAVQVRALVDETDIGKIRPDMAARVTVAAYPNQPFPGKVVKIEPEAVVVQNVTMFAVLISLDNSEGLLLPGMNAEVDIQIAQTTDALTIPVMALRTNRDVVSTAGILGMSEEALRAKLSQSGGSKDAAAPAAGSEHGRPAGAPTAAHRNGGARPDYRFGGRFWVVVKGASGPEIRHVRTGITDLDRVEVLDGLDDGETVLILPSSNLVETQQDLQQFINRRIGSVPGISR
ncbi:MAG: efflux RND transporter periplasmic adaptor subunit [Woeseiaceae bacterium]